MLASLTDQRVVLPLLVRRGTNEFDSPTAVSTFLDVTHSVGEDQMRVKDVAIFRVDMTSLDSLVEQLNKLFVTECSEAIHEIGSCHLSFLG
jgi:hypothetical protein